MHLEIKLKSTIKRIFMLCQFVANSIIDGFENLPLKIDWFRQIHQAHVHETTSLIKGAVKFFLRLVDSGPVLEQQSI